MEEEKKKIKKIGIIGCGFEGKTSIALLKVMEEAKLKGIEIVHLGKDIDSLNPEDLKQYQTIIDSNNFLMSPPPIPITELQGGRYDFDGTPNGLKYLKNLNLSPEQIEYYQSAPSYRAENESDKDYKQRRKISKLICKYRGRF